MHSSRRIAIAAVGLAVAVVSAVSMPRLLTRPAPAASAPRTGCTLPVEVGNGTPGFVDTKTGQFTAYLAGPDGMPPNFGQYSFDSTFDIWVPVPSNQIAPDGRDYVYQPPLGVYGHLILRVFAIDTRVDRLLGVFAGFSEVWRWEADGIHLVGLDMPEEYVVDPTTGKEHHIGLIHASVPGFEPLPSDPQQGNGTSIHLLGYTAGGHPIFWIFNLERAGASDWVFYETEPGHRVYVYKGKMGDTTDFEPGAAVADGFGAWFSDYHQRQLVWHWDPSRGLREIKVTHAPYLKVVPAGPCFKASRAS